MGKMVELTWNGPHEIAGPKGEAVKPGSTVEVPERIAEDMIRSTAGWSRGSKTKHTKPAAPTVKK